MKIGLGTVQFGLDYGINNSFGKTPEEECAEVFHCAKINQISFIDTAYGYGDAQSIIGRNTFLADDWKIVTKISVTKNEYINSEDRLVFKNVFNNSLLEMRRKNVYALLLHNEKDLFKPGSEQIIEELNILKDKGVIKKIGVSLYDINLINKVIDLNFIDLVQVPINILDQRLIFSGLLEKLNNKGIEIHARSIFLQGLLLQDPITIDDYFNPVKEKLIKLKNEAKTRDITVLQLLLGFIQGISLVDVAVVGVNNAVQLEEITDSLGVIINPKELTHLYVEEERFINPSKWEINEN